MVRGRPPTVSVPMLSAWSRLTISVPRWAKGDVMTTQTIDALRARVSGPVIAPGDPGYDEARKVYNFMIDRHPAAVVRCRNADDVVAVVRQAAQDGSELAVRGGEHSVPGFGTADDALVADLSGLSSVTVDASGQTARVGGGATWGASTTPRVRTGSRRPAASSPRPGSADSPSVAGSATSPVGTGCPATTCSRPRSSPRTGRW